MKAGGIFEITTPRHLVEKATHDIERLRANPLDAYAAFDFFVTARHVPDWLYPNDAGKRDALFEQYVELRVCRHLADGAKHFLVTHHRHKQVQRTVQTHSAWGRSWGDSWGASWGREELIVHLDPSDGETGKLGRQIAALKLAEKVITILGRLVP